ncbi:ATP-binding cassette sub-family C member 11 [Ceratocystis fimbriata CBS 114723]|uniref:ATP-binding cassette sub-family C member 11 n=1 Tax=Ceratocystis fimbriata CBS 114723 TaxID=1035309 RepID=A0A2C5X556_9PEZI|nr:ATP-binding cassette sub-family C member 11 [Ceratocystis fimbriata CBS 114723]
MWTVNPNRAVEPMSLKMKNSLKNRIDGGSKHPLAFAIYDTYRFEFILAGVLQLTSSVMQVVSPFLLRYLIQFASDAWVAKKTGEPAPRISTGMGYVLGVTLMQVVMSMATNHFIFRGMMVGGQSRATLISLIFEKSMSLSGRARAGGMGEGAEKPESPQGKPAGRSKKSKNSSPSSPAANPSVDSDGVGWPNGRVVNLMSVDTYRIDQCFALFHALWTTPVQMIITLALLLVNLTYSALAGFALIFVMMPLLSRAIKSLFARRKAINKITDQRVSLTQEILQSVRFVKFFGWENAFMNRLQGIRSIEIRHIQTLMAIRSGINAVSMSMPAFASMLAFITYTLTNHNMQAAQIFSSLALFNSLRMPLNLFPMVLGNVIDAWSSVKRTQEYLLAEEMEEDVRVDKTSKHAMELNRASFTWEQTQAQAPETSAEEMAKNNAMQNDNHIEDHSADRQAFRLDNLNISFGRNELVAVIGSVGSGKTSLLSALAGDMRKTGGEVVLGADRAFCPQYAWVQNATLQKNILFGKPMNKAWYEEVIHACALQPDLEMLPSGDQTEIGERGITISGGQKQRLNIARAIYFDADIVLMDDPLSAVDAHVGRHIFENAIRGLLKHKCRILATHQLWVLSRCDRVVWMEGGKIQAVGTYEELLSNNDGFRTLVETTAQDEKKNEESTSKEDSNEDGDVSEQDSKAVKKKKPVAAPALMQQEERAVSSVSWSVYATYIRASGTLMNAPILLVLLCLVQGANITMGLWLSYWTSDRFHMTTGQYIGVYIGLALVQCLLAFLFSGLLAVLETRASKHMLSRAMSRVLRAPMSFFDTTPLGRITNRFSRDVDVMDNALGDAMRMYLFTVSMILGVFGLIIAYFHWFAVALAPLAALFFFSAGYYRSSAREVKRFESVLRSDVFARFSEGLSGVASIRAYGLKAQFLRELRESVDEMNAAYFLTFSNQRWLAVRLDFVGCLLVFTCGTLVVTSRFSVSPSIGGLVLSYILSIVQMIQFTVRQLAEVENGMNAVERLNHYGTNLEEEAPLHTIEVPPKWPEKGEIVFENVEMRYRADLPLVLRGLSIHVQGGERIGIIGRTGAGKSSIMSTLFRLVEISSGKITIDGLNISTLGLHELRSRMAIIPQDPTLFHGTVRSNLDPFHEHTDLELWSALRQAGLSTESGSSESSPTSTSALDSEKAEPTNNDASSGIHLDTVVEEEGLNFSLGQRQLMALARALVRNSQVIVCDEATSSVDVETDDRIQHTIATAFKGRTLLCIAHRLRTIVGYDRICVMDRGQIAQLDTPLNLWKDEDGIFRSMCERSGIRLEDIRRDSKE